MEKGFLFHSAKAYEKTVWPNLEADLEKRNYIHDHTK